MTFFPLVFGFYSNTAYKHWMCFFCLGSFVVLSLSFSISFFSCCLTINLLWVKFGKCMDEKIKWRTMLLHMMCSLFSLSTVLNGFFFLHRFNLCNVFLVFYCAFTTQRILSFYSLTWKNQSASDSVFAWLDKFPINLSLNFNRILSLRV